jgi:hypothetical protein
LLAQLFIQIGFGLSVHPGDEFVVHIQGLVDGVVVDCYRG